MPRDVNEERRKTEEVRGKKKTGTKRKCRKVRKTKASPLVGERCGRADERRWSGSGAVTL